MTSFFCGRSSSISSRGVMLCLLILVLAGTAEGTLWGEPKTAQLKWGEETAIDSYRVRAEEFLIDARGKVSVNLNISDKNNLSDRNIILSTWNGSDGNSWSLEDKLRIEVRSIREESINENDFIADIKLQTPTIPEISLTLNPDSKSCEVGDDIELNFAATNTLTENIENLWIAFDCNQDLIRKELHGMVKRPKGGQLRSKGTWEGSIRLKAPFLLRTEDVEISATAEYTVASGENYRVQAKTPIQIIYAPFKLTKHVNYRNMSVDSVNTVNLILRYSPLSSIKNDVPFDPCEPDFSVIPPGIKVGAESCDSSDCYKTYSYGIRANRPGSYILPAARMNYTICNTKYYEISESPKVDVFGPYIDAYGSVYVWPGQEGEGYGKASITLKNIGNKNAYDVVVKCDESCRAGLVKGEAAREWAAAPRLEPNENRTVIIQLKRNESGKCDNQTLWVEYKYFNLLNKTFESGSTAVRFGNKTPQSLPAPQNNDTATISQEEPNQGSIENFLNKFVNNIFSIKIRI